MRVARGIGSGDPRMSDVRGDLDNRFFGLEVLPIVGTVRVAEDDSNSSFDESSSLDVTSSLSSFSDFDSTTKSTTGTSGISGRIGLNSPSSDSSDEIIMMRLLEGM